MSRIWVGIVVSLIAVCAVFAVLHLDRGRFDLAASYADKLAYWKMRIHAVGAPRAYGELVAFLDTYPLSVQHRETHVFGSALYSEEGLPGISVCDDHFDNACFHQFVAEALSDLGTGSLHQIIEACNGASGCRHSIGHGVIGLLGYSFDDLTKAVSICESLPNDTYVHGCYGGIFMEYNVRRFLGDAQTSRPMGQDWFDPCDRLSKSTQRVCYFWQPTWWRSSLVDTERNLSPSALTRMGEKCQTVRDTELRAACFEGIGVSALYAGQTTTRDAVSACAFTSKDLKDQARCRTSVARLVALRGGAEEARSICENLPDTYLAGCLRVVQSASPETSYLGEVLPFEKKI